MDVQKKKKKKNGKKDKNKINYLLTETIDQRDTVADRYDTGERNSFKPDDNNDAS